MNIKLIGSILIMLACGGAGYLTAAAYRREMQSLRQLIGALEYMECELQYRLTSLPDLCRCAALHCADPLRMIFTIFTDELESQISPNAERCMDAALVKCNCIPKITQEMLRLLGSLLGRFDLDGQLKGLVSVRQSAMSNLQMLEANKDVRMRGYQTLGFCAGAAIVIMIM